MTQRLVSAPSKLTPMMEQVRSIQKRLPPGTILFFRLGDFYEMFFEDAVRASEILNLTLTGRDAGAAGRVPMCGVPHHAFRQYVRMLLDQNLKVAICEQIGDPRLAKGLVERKVTRIITPATYLDEENGSARPEYIAAAVRLEDRAGIAALDLGTGDFFVREVGGSRLLSELSRIAPREVILPASFTADRQLERFLKGELGAAVSVVEDGAFERESAGRLLEETFSARAPEALAALAGRPLETAAAGALVRYLKDHGHEALSHLRPPGIEARRATMALDPHTVRSLELVPPPGREKDSATLFGCLDRTLTSMGRRTLYGWVVRPLTGLDEIGARQAAVAELVEGKIRLETLRSLLKGVRDVERILSRLNYGVAHGRDLIGLKEFLNRLPEFQQRLASAQAPPLRAAGGALAPMPELCEAIRSALVDDPPASVREGGVIRPGYCPELDELRDLSAKGKSWLAEFERREAERTGIRSLRIRYNQVFGYSIEVSKANLSRVPPEYLRKQTLANAERFVVPELRSWDERISGAQEKIRRLEFELFQSLRRRVLAALVSLQAAARAAGELDALAALALTAVENRWVRPKLTEEKVIRVRGGRHPVVERMLPAGEFVENDAQLDGGGRQVVLLTGPNMAGKSTFIRQTALIVLLAQIGSYVPAEEAEIGWADRIFTRVGARDDLSRGESTFMVEMNEMAQILREATDRSLVILDEVGRGTSTFDGVSLAWAICEHLVREPVRPRTLFATHYHELTRLEEESSAVKNYTVSVRETGEEVLFLRKVVRGGSDRSYGIHVAHLAGIPPEVTARAREILKILDAENRQASRRIEGKTAPAAAPARSGSEAAQAPHPVLEEIRAADPERLTPLEALQRLADWKRRLSE